MKPRHFDIRSQAYKRNPYPTLARLIDEGPVLRMKFPLIGGAWVVTDYDAVNELFAIAKALCAIRARRA